MRTLMTVMVVMAAGAVAIASSAAVGGSERPVPGQLVAETSELTGLTSYTYRYGDGQRISPLEMLYDNQVDFLLYPQVYVMSNGEITLELVVFGGGIGPYPERVRFTIEVLRQNGSDEIVNTIQFEVKLRDLSPSFDAIKKAVLHSTASGHFVTSLLRGLNVDRAVLDAFTKPNRIIAQLDFGDIKYDYVRVTSPSAGLTAAPSYRSRVIRETELFEVLEVVERVRDFFLVKDPVTDSFLYIDHRAVEFPSEDDIGRALIDPLAWRAVVWKYKELRGWV